MKQELLDFIIDLKIQDYDLFKRLELEILNRGITLKTWNQIIEYKKLQIALEKHLKNLNPEFLFNEYCKNFDCLQFKEAQSFNAFLDFHLRSGMLFSINQKYYNKFKAIDYLQISLKNYFINNKARQSFIWCK